MVLLLSENLVPATGRILFSWPHAQGSNLLAEALRDLELNFWNIETDGTLFRTTWHEMSAQASQIESYYIAAQTLD